jgi:hypothetical protein
MRLQPIFGATRAEAIAATEVTRVVAAGNETLWQSTGVVSGKRWMTARDERVCPICGPLHGRLTELNRGFEFTPDDLANNEELRKALRGATAITILRPPAHVRCRCWEQPFVSEELLRRELDRIV